MSALSRFGSRVAKPSAYYYHARFMATANTATDYIQGLFVEKIREFKSADKGLDAAHQKALSEELQRLKRAFKVEDEARLAQIELKFPHEHDISLRSLDEDKEHREKALSGQLVRHDTRSSPILDKVPEEVHVEFHMPPHNKPDFKDRLDWVGRPQPPAIEEERPDYERPNFDPVTPDLLERELLVRFGPKMPTIDDDKSPERDTVNFPRLKPNLDTPPTRHHFIPESWFRFFYPKTGVTGPYTLVATLGTFLMSKEWIVVEQEFHTALSMTLIFTYATIKFGPKISEYCRKGVQKDVDAWDNWTNGYIKVLDQLHDHYKGELSKGDMFQHLYDIRRKDVEMQLHCEHRTRLMKVYEDTRRRLNYLVAVADSQRQIAHKNMVNWVISNVMSSIGPKQEAEVLDNCIANLKLLARKNANVV